MAGDWIKMRADLFTHPKVVRISSALKADTLRTVGGLMSVWCLFDTHSIDGKLDGYSPEVLDAHLRWDGFSAQMAAVGWLIFESTDTTQALALPRFDAHNGQSAKRRAQDADRKKDVREMSASDADKKRTREEKRREEVNQSSVTSNADDEKASAEESDLPEPTLPKVETLTPCPQKEILDLYAELLPELPQPRLWEGARESSLRSRWSSVLADLKRKEKPCDKAAGLEYFRRLFSYITKSDFLMGRNARWSADLGWIVKSENFAKIIQGNYDNKIGAQA